MSRFPWLPILGLAGLLGLTSAALGQATPYIGFVYPAGGQQGTTFQVRLGGQRLDGCSGAIVTGEGVSAKLVEYRRKMSNQEARILREQLKELKQEQKKRRKAKKRQDEKGPVANDKPAQDEATQKLLARVEERIADYVNRPACVSLASIALIEVRIAPNAKPGSREIRLVTPRGVTNPMVFHVGQVREVAREPMKTCQFQVLGKEHLALRNRPAEEVEQRITVPCTMNGQIASGEVNRYRFEAHKGQRLVVSTAARQLIPYIADAVPGWFQPVLRLCDADGKELAFNDDYRQNPDPVIFFDVPKDGEYLLTITDAIYRGREDFVYRITIGELPFVTNIFPLGGRVGSKASVEMNGWNLQNAKLTLPPKTAAQGVHLIAANKDGVVSNVVPFALDTLPECFDEESNNDSSHAQKVELPIIVNGRIDHQDDWDVFQIAGHRGDRIVAEVTARRLDSPLDSMLKITDATGKLLGMNDDHEAPESGLNTHHADSYLMFTLPSDGTYYVHLGDTARNGGEEFAYRLRISAPRPDFALRTVPSSVALRSKGGAGVSVYVIRKDGFDGDIKLQLKDPPEGFLASSRSIAKKKAVTRLAVRTTLEATEQPVSLVIEGHAKIQEQDIVHEAVPAEDRMQAFLWRHLVTAEELKALVFNPSYEPPPKRVFTPPPAEEKPKSEAAESEDNKPKFSKKQVAGRLRQLKWLYEAWLLTDDFYGRKVAECEAAL